jgi:branched-chain amino acid transport system ATP-binding protein
MLNISHINVYHGYLQALWDVSLEIEEGEIVALIGSNGAGKTTLLKTVSGLLRPASGKITFEGLHLEKRPVHKIVELGICLVPEGRGLFPEMSVLENLEMGAFLPKSRQDKNETLEWVYEIFPVLEERRNQLAGTLSGGEQQMVAIGRGLMSKPKSLLLDEISLGLAPVIVQELFRIILQINAAKVTIFLVEQNIHLALETASRAYVIENGRILGQGDAHSLLNDPRVKGAYLG